MQRRGYHVQQDLKRGEHHQQQTILHARNQQKHFEEEQQRSRLQADWLHRAAQTAEPDKHREVRTYEGEAVAAMYDQDTCEGCAREQMIRRQGQVALLETKNETQAAPTSTTKARSAG